jgi:hypothetical protein
VGLFSISSPGQPQGRAVCDHAGEAKVSDPTERESAADLISDRRLMPWRLPKIPQSRDKLTIGPSFVTTAG